MVGDVARSQCCYNPSSFLFFIIFHVLCSFVVMNLFVAAIIEHFADLSDFGSESVQQRLMNSLGSWVRQWETFDPEVGHRLCWGGTFIGTWW